MNGTPDRKTAPRKRRGCLPGLIAKLLAGGGEKYSGPVLPRVMVSKKFFSPAEANFFRTLTGVVGARGIVLGQVAVNQLLFLPGSEKTNPGRATWKNKLARRSVDFVVCHPTTLRPCVAIELDEPSHATPTRQQRDEENEVMFEAAGLPLLRVITSRQYSTRELTDAVLPHLG